MKLDALFKLLAAAREASSHREFVVLGSLSILGMEEAAAIPADMSMSIDADCYTRADPGRVFLLAPLLGEGSAFHHEHGYYLDPISPAVATLPEGWEQRLIGIEREGVLAQFLEPTDAAISKLARGEPRDLRWVRAGLRAGLVSAPMLRLRASRTSFFDADEQCQTLQRIAKLIPATSRPARRGVS